MILGAFFYCIRITMFKLFLKLFETSYIFFYLHIISYFKTFHSERKEMYNVQNQTSKQKRN